MPNLSTQQLAELLVGIARAQQAIIDAIESSKAGFKSTHLAPALTNVARVRDTHRPMQLGDLPADKVPNWDFDAPSQFKDSSASAITASALLMMGKVNPASAATYGAAGRDLLKALTNAPYLAQGTNSRSILNHGAWYIPPPLSTGESGTVWGDYYFLEAINRYQGKL